MVLRASPAVALEAALETNDSAAQIIADETILGEIAPELIAGTAWTLSRRRPRQPAKARLSAPQAENARRAVLEQAVTLSARRARWVSVEQNHSSGAGDRPVATWPHFHSRSNFVRGHPILSDGIPLIFAYWK